MFVDLDDWYVLYTDEILSVPVSAQFLWYNLAAEADDDGIVENARGVRKRLGADDEDVRYLIHAKLVEITEDKKVKMRYPGGEQPQFITKENGITYALVKPFIPGYGYIQTAKPFEVPLIW